MFWIYSRFSMTQTKQIVGNYLPNQTYLIYISIKLLILYMSSFDLPVSRAFFGDREYD